MIMPKQAQGGFSLIELLISIGASLLVAVLAMEVLLRTQVATRDTEKGQELLENKNNAINIILESCAIANTVQSAAVSGLGCLQSGTCNGNESGSFVLRDRSNQIVVFPSDPGYTFNLSYEIDCPLGNCAKAYAVITGSAEPTKNTTFAGTTSAGTTSTNLERFKFVRTVSYQRKYSNCLEAYNDGQTASGLINLDPDGAGGRCPFTTYCDQGSDGGGWTLLITAGESGYTTIPVIETNLVPGMVGRLSDNQITALLRTSAGGMGGNNLKVQIDGTLMGKLVVSLNSMGHSAPGMFNVAQTMCSAYNTTAGPTQYSSQGLWQFASIAGQGSVGLKNGTFECKACGATTTCGLTPNACCSTSLRGGVWLR